jgi:xanthine dehydrogenase accessory factor
MKSPLNWYQAIAKSTRQGEPYVLVTILGVAGSAPREPASKMVVSAKSTYDTIGGGKLEFQIIEQARRRLAGKQYGHELAEFTLGSQMGQCCGGRISVLLEVRPGCDAHLVLFGAGHVAHALVKLLGELPWRITWVDARADCFPPVTPDLIHAHITQDPVGEAPVLCQNAHALILTHDHQLDFELCRVLLNTDQVRSIGLIGSRTKAERFRHRLLDFGHARTEIDRIRCPVGRRDVPGKQPMEVAVDIAAELLRINTPSPALPSHQRGIAGQDLTILRALTLPDNDPPYRNGSIE